MAHDLKRLIQEVKEARAEFEARLDDVDVAKERYYETVRRLYDQGMPLREIAETIGVSHQRVHQIVGEKPQRGKAKRALAKHARAGSAALVIVALAASWIASSVNAQPRQEAIAELKPARNLIARQLSGEARDFILPRLDDMLEEERR